MNRTGFIGDSLVMSVLKNEKKPEERTKFLDFMEERWNIEFESLEDKKVLLFLGKKDEVKSEQSD